MAYNKSFTLLLLEMGLLLIMIMAMERVVEYTLKVQNSLSHRLPRLTWEASKKIQQTIKAKLCVHIRCKIWKMV